MLRHIWCWLRGLFGHCWHSLGSSRNRDLPKEFRTHGKFQQCRESYYNVCCRCGQERVVKSCIWFDVRP